ncbi:MAG TPA: hypothetical protein VGG53_21615 [Mycobacterium sp.]|jgi:uncharacterized DUF497 family protein
MLEFEFYAAKSAANLVKHGIDFAAAQSIWIISVRRSRESEVAIYEG